MTQPTPEHTSRPLVSIVIVTFNSAASIGECLDSLLPSWTELTELLVVDNASTDKTCSIVRGHSLAPRLIANSTNVGFASAVNQGCAASGSAIIVLLNPDTRVEEGFLTKLLQSFSTHAEAAVIGCNLVDDRGAHQPSCWKTPSLLMVALEVLLPHSLALPLITVNPTTVTEVPMVSGACMGVRRDRFERLGGMDSGFFMYYEDADFCLRIRQQGFKVMYVPGIRVVHRMGGSTSNQESFYLQIHQSKLKFLRKHQSRTTFWLGYLLILFGIVIRIPAYAVAGMLLFRKSLLHLAKVHTLVLRSIVGRNI